MDWERSTSAKTDDGNDLGVYHRDVRRLAEEFLMSGVDEQNQGLPAWMQRGTIPPKSPHPPRGRSLVTWLLGLVVAAAVLAGGIALFGGGRSTSANSAAADSNVLEPTVPVSSALNGVSNASTTEPTTVAPTTVAPTTEPTTVAPTTVAPTTVAPTTVAPTTVAPTTVAPTTVVAPQSTVPLGSLLPRSAVFAQGKIYLRGTVPSQAVADVIIGKAAQVLGRDNVIVEYVVDSRAPVTNEGVLSVADTVLFTPNSADLTTDFLPILNLGVVLMKQNEKVTIDVVGHTDSDGSVHTNQTLAQGRCDAVIAYLTAAGIEPGRLTAQAKGQAEPIADNASAEGRRLNRRVEFVIHGLLEG